MKHVNENEILEVKEIPYFQTPNDIFDMDLDISTIEQLIYIYLCRCGNNGKTAWPSYNTIAAKCKCSRRTAIESIKNLLAKGLVHKKARFNIDKDENASNIYIVNIELKKLSTESTPSANAAPPPSAEVAPPSANAALPPSANAAPPSAIAAPYKEPSKNNNSSYKEQGKEESTSNPPSLNNPIDKLVEFARNRLGDVVNIKTFISCLDIKAINENEIEVIAPNKFTKGIVDARYKDLIADFVFEEYHFKPQVVITHEIA